MLGWNKERTGTERRYGDVRHGWREGEEIGGFGGVLEWYEGWTETRGYDIET